MLESDTTQLAQRIETADAAIQARLRELPETSRLSEQVDLHSALSYLRRMKASLPS